MTTKVEATTTEKRDPIRPPGAVPAPLVADLVTPRLLPPTRAAKALTDPRYGTVPNQPRHLEVLLALQQTHGNRFVQRLIAAQASGRAAAPEQEEEPEGPPFRACPEPSEGAAAGIPGPLPSAGPLAGGAPGKGAGDLAGAIDAESGRGQPLPEVARRRLEPALEADLSGVQVHTGTAADRLAVAVEAVAFTTGPDIFFRAGAYDPASPQGMRLLAHEVAHTLQQAAGPVAGRPSAGGVAVSDPADRFEQAAGAMAERVVDEEGDKDDPSILPGTGPEGREGVARGLVPRHVPGAAQEPSPSASSGQTLSLAKGSAPATLGVDTRIAQEPDEEDSQEEEEEGEGTQVQRIAAAGSGSAVGPRGAPTRRSEPVLQRQEAAGAGTGAGARGRGTTTIRPVARATYAVSAATLAEAAAQIEAREEAGLTEWVPAYSLSRDEAGNVTDATVTVTITVTMPSWPGAARLPAAAKAEWDRFYAALEAHEQGHVSLVRENLGNVAESLVGKSEAEAVEAFQAALTALQSASDAYDAANDHGRNAGCTVDIGKEEPARESAEGAPPEAPEMAPTLQQGLPPPPPVEEAPGETTTEPHVPGQRAVQRAAVPGPRSTAREAGGAAGVLVVQREDGPAAPGVTVRLGSITASTHGHLLAALRYFVVQLRQELEDVEAGAPARRGADDLLQEATTLRSYLEGREDQPIDERAASYARSWYADYTRAIEDLQSYKRRRAADELARAQGPIDAARRRLEDQQPRLDDLMRAAFLAENQSLLEQVTGAVSNSLDTGLAISELSRDLAEDVARIRGGTGTLPPASQFVGLLNKLNRSLAAYSLLTSALSGGGGGRTAMSAGANRVAAAAGAASSLGTLLGLSASFTLYCNLYLVPAATAAVAAIRRIITEHNHELNLLALELGEGTIDWSVEPGGEPMYRFMSAVMAAGGPEGVPDPVPAAVSSYFVDQEGALQTGTGEEVPTTGFWFWEKTDPARIRRWVFRNRRNLWAMFFGSLRPPA